MLLVYSHQISPRLKYIFKQVCTRILGIPLSFTSSVDEFVAHDSMKMSYTTQPLGNEIFIRSHPILFEQGLSDLEIHVQDWDETKCFFHVGDKSSIPFDIFSASFYLLSRYEEYLPHVKDEYGRFMAKDSLAYQNQFLHQPVVDIWAYKFRKLLKTTYPDYKFTKRQFKIDPIIDVPMAYYFKNKGILRSIGGTFNEISRLRIGKLYQRFMVLFGLKPDPYNTFDWIIEIQKKYKSKFKIFFLIGDYSTYDKNVSVNKKAFVSLIKSVADYSDVGLKASYFALEEFNILKREKNKMEAIINTTLERARNSFSKLNLPNSYRFLLELEINEDYTMGYVDQIGFRAGTCTPFLFYDIDYEIQTPLLINSYNIMDYALLKHISLLDKQQEMMQLISEVRKVKGTFVPVFHNYTFSDDKQWKGFKELFIMALNVNNEA